MKRPKIAVLVLGIALSLPGILHAKCAHFSCDPSVNYAMGREKMILALRLGQLTNAVMQMAKETKEKTNKLMAKEALQLLRLRERYAIRTYNVMREGHRVRKTLEAVLLSVDMTQLMIQSKEGQALYTLTKGMR